MDSVKNIFKKNKIKTVIVLSAILIFTIILCAVLSNKGTSNGVDLNSPLGKELANVIDMLSSEKNEILSDFSDATEENGIILISGAFAELKGTYKVFTDDDGTVSQVIFVRDDEIQNVDKIVNDISACLGDFDDYDAEWNRYEWETDILRLILYVDERIYFELNNEKNPDYAYKSENTSINQSTDDVNSDSLSKNQNFKDIKKQFNSIKRILKTKKVEDILKSFDNGSISENGNIIIDGMFSDVVGSYEVYCWNNDAYQIVFRWDEDEIIAPSEIVSEVNGCIGEYISHNEYWDIYEWEKDGIEISFNTEDGVWFEPVFTKSPSEAPENIESSISEKNYLSISEENIVNEIATIKKMLSYGGKPKEKVFADYPNLFDDDWNQLIMPGNMFGIKGRYVFIYDNDTGIIYSVAFDWIPDNLEKHEKHIVSCLNEYFGYCTDAHDTEFNGEMYHFHDWDATTEENWSVHLSMREVNGWLQFSELEDEAQSESEEHSCVECGKSASYTYTNPFSNEVENYCYTHYNEIINMIGEMEEDVGAGSFSKHTCEECSREGTHSIVGISGQTEYYCTTHYNELKEFMQVLQ